MWWENFLDERHCRAIDACPAVVICQRQARIHYVPGIVPVWRGTICDTVLSCASLWIIASGAIKLFYSRTLAQTLELFVLLWAQRLGSEIVYTRTVVNKSLLWWITCLESYLYDNIEGFSTEEVCSSNISQIMSVHSATQWII